MSGFSNYAAEWWFEMGEKKMRPREADFVGAIHNEIKTIAEQTKPVEPNGADYGTRFAEAYRKLETERDELGQELAAARSYIADVISKNDRLMAVSKIEIDALQVQLLEEKSRVLSFQNDWKDMAERANRVEAVLSAIQQIVQPYQKPPLPAVLTDAEQKEVRIAANTMVRTPT